MSGTGRHADRALLPADGPLRHTGGRTAAEMTRRAGRLIGMHVLVPGSAQLVAGDRRLGRVVVGVWIALWALVLAALLTWLVQRDVIIAVATSATGLTVVEVGLLLVAVAWLAVTIDVLRLTRLLRLTAWARPLVAGGLVLLAFAGAAVASWGAVSAGVARGALVSVFAAASPVRTAAAQATEYDVLLLGMDRPRGGGALVPKSVSVVRIDAKTGAATIIGVPTTLRDVPFPASSPMHRLYPHGYRDCIAAPCTLADVYTEARVVGGPLYPDATAQGTTAAAEAMRDAVSGATGLDVAYTAQIDTAALGSLIDALGGVRVAVPAAEASATLPAGTARLDGRRAVAYLRGSSGADGAQQVDRVLRVEQALLTQVNPANALLRFRTVAAASSGALRTDLPQDTVTTLAVLGLKTRTRAVQEVRLVPPAVDPARPDYAAIRRLVGASVR